MTGRLEKLTVCGALSIHGVDTPSGKHPRSAVEGELDVALHHQHFHAFFSVSNDDDGRGRVRFGRGHFRQSISAGPEFGSAAAAKVAARPRTRTARTSH
jgi:hypothetical protein